MNEHQTIINTDIHLPLITAQSDKLKNKTKTKRTKAWTPRNSLKTGVESGVPEG